MDLTVVRDAGIEDARRLLEIYRYVTVVRGKHRDIF